MSIMLTSTTIIDFAVKVLIFFIWVCGVVYTVLAA